jgi:hypothetical protein
MVSMSRITSSLLRTGIFNLAVVFFLTGLCHAQQFQPIDKSTITIFDSFAAFPGYDAPFCLDTTGNGPVSADNQFITDYASLGGGANTFLSFDFGQQYTFAAILFTDRTTSGGPNDLYVGGTFDFNTSYMFTFSNDQTFTNNVGTVVVTVNPPSQPTTIDSFQTLSIISGIPPAQYVKWQVLATNGNNPGASDFAFFGQ